MKSLLQEYLNPSTMKIINSFELNILKYFWSYLILYVKGGIYSSTDTRLLKTF